MRLLPSAFWMKNPMKSEAIIRGRFAPSPSGTLHLGNLLSSLLAWLDVRSQGGVMLFRLEDLDPDRSFEHYANQMARDLEWLGLDRDEGWRPGSDQCRQGNRTAHYENALKQLREKGLVYDCYCSRAERLAASAPHPGEAHDAGCGCRFLTEAEARQKRHSGRSPAQKCLIMPQTIRWTDVHYGFQEDPLQSGQDDFIIRRSDGVFAYQLAVSVDDIEMGVTRVVRAQDLMRSTARQIYLIQTLGGSAPEYCHAPLLIAPDGRKLSKRDGDLNMDYFREHFTPEQLIGILAKLAGLQATSSPIKARELVESFSWESVPRNPIVIPSELI